MTNRKARLAILCALAMLLIWLFDHPAQPAPEPNLTCFVLGVPNPIPPTDVVTFRRRDLWTTVGINRKFGGIAVELTLTDPASPNAPLEIVDARSAGGAGWQTAIGAADAGEAKIFHVNQAAGNSARNWGFESSYSLNETQGIIQEQWLPLMSNDYRQGLSFTAPTVTTSPCYGTGIKIGDGKGSITPSGGSSAALRLNNSYLVRWSTSREWKWFDEEQALYINPRSARMGDLRVYIARAGSPVIGPIRPQNKPENTAQGIPEILGTDEDWNAKVFPASYAVLVFNLAGKDVGIAIHQPDNQPFAGFFRFRPHLMCKQETDYCRSVQWHTVSTSRFDQSVKSRFSAGEITQHVVQYDFGSLDELSRAGYTVSH